MVCHQAPAALSTLRFAPLTRRLGQSWILSAPYKFLGEIHRISFRCNALHFAFAIVGCVCVCLCVCVCVCVCVCMYDAFVDLRKTV